MTKPALMIFRLIKAIKFYFNAKLTKVLTITNRINI